MAGILRFCGLTVLGLVPGLSLALAACTDGQGGQRPSDGPDLVAPHPFPADVAAVPAGYREVLCPDLRASGTGLTLRLVVPVGVKSGHQTDSGCGFSLDSSFQSAIGVQLDPEANLARWRAKWLDPFEAEGGDDSVSDIAYRGSVDGFDHHYAEELTWHAYNDGSPMHSRSILAAGVRLTWSAAEGEAIPEDAFDLVRRSVAVLVGTRARCPMWDAGGGPALSYAPPTGIGWIEPERGRCRIYFEGAPTTLEYAVVTPTPGPLDRLADRARSDPEVVRVRLERGVTELAGEPADRLTWVVVRTEETENHEPAGTWRIVVLQSAHARIEWGQTPAWWRAHRSTYDAVVASVQVSPGPPSPP